MLSDDFEHVDQPFSLLALSRLTPVAGAWWADPALHRRCLGDMPIYWLRDGAPAAIWARFPELVGRKLAAEMLQLAGHCQIICEALPEGWSAPIEVIIWRRPQRRLGRG